jgi:hypothetical protein
MFNLRSYKLLDIAIFDVVMTFIFAIILQKYYAKNTNIMTVFLILIIIAIFIHYIFNIPTKLNYYLNLSKDPRLILK